MKAEIITIGDELLNGSIHNTNATWIADQMWRIGIPVRFVTTIGDEANEVQSALTRSLSRVNIVLMTGGLGPTHDDVTKNAVAVFFGAELIEDKDLRSRIENRFADRGVPMPRVNLEQALVPKGAVILPNQLGTAACFYFERNEQFCFVMPGVPAEMQQIMQETVLPLLKQRFAGQTGSVVYQTIRTTGIFESGLYEALFPLQEITQLVNLAFLPHYGGVDLRLGAHTANAKDAQGKIAAATEIICRKISPFIYEIGERNLEQVVADLLILKHYTVSVAESCTGGLLGNMLTSIPGSSSYFEGGVIAYANSVKQQLLKVPENILNQFGAVSAETAKAMLQGLKSVFHSDCALATTGIAGPTGGTVDKPVGTVFVGCLVKEELQVQKYIFHRDRLINKYRFAFAALNLLRQKLLE